ncbi:hypothetical protein SAMN06272781_6848 [Streptomyces sp. 1222.2]|uniref:NUDIX hydrolase n=1 Tax=Streptomyces sp. 1222.2 TaxID=1938833 RepID=UPI000BC78606|nr:NUDIX hydrolase [Streptomyces sp. 1222.2]SOD80061.1 hypothetical protein SAMN06272781_6848 [Streptomyces sp. 1222.2]
MTSPLTTQQLNELKPLAAVITKALRETPVRLGSDDWADSLGSELVVRVAAYMGGVLGPDAGVLAEVQAERERQDARWGEQNHPDGTGALSCVLERDKARQGCESAFQRGAGTWMHVLIEEVFEAFAEEDPAKLRAELVQVAAVAVAWIAAIDRRPADITERGCPGFEKEYQGVSDAKRRLANCKHCGKPRDGHAAVSSVV